MKLGKEANLSRVFSISVIIPVYNGERFLAEAIRSVLDQTRPPDEIIVVDDGSTDGTARIVADLAATAVVPIRYVYQNNRGPAAARNHGLRLSNGDIIAFQDADDIWTNDKLEKQVNILQRSPKKQIVMGKTQYVQLSPEGNLIACSGPYAEPGYVIMLQAAIFRRTVFESVGLFDESLRFCEDTDWYFRALENDVGISIHPDLVVLYRRHESNVTNDRNAARSHFLLALKMALGRRRQYQNSGVATSSFTRITETLKS